MKKLLLLAALLFLAYLAFGTGFGEYLKPQFYQQLYQEHPTLTLGAYFIAYVLMAVLSIPAAALMTLLSGVVFGFWVGLVLISFASSIGATFSFLIARTLLRDWVEQRFGKYLEKINRGMERDGAFYLFSLRLIPVIPFFVLNPVMGLTRMKAKTFYIVSQIGMLPVTAIYINAGVQIGRIDELSVEGILTPELLTGIILLAIAPFLARNLVQAIRRRRSYKPWKGQRPKSFDTNLVVIGAGSAGLVSAYIAAAVKAKVVLIEKQAMGGDCLNTGCVPSKALIKSAAVARTLQRAEQFGLQPVTATADFPRVMQRVQEIIKKIEPHDSASRYESLGVEVVQGEAELLSPWKVRVGDREISAKNIVLATGASPRIPDYRGLDQIAYLTSDTIWQIRELPRHLLILGSGAVACELAQAFCRLGSEVSVAFRSKRLLPKEDEDVSAELTRRFESEGIHILEEHQVEYFQKGTEQDKVCFSWHGQQTELEFSRVLVATGRQANVSIPGLEKLDLDLNSDGTLFVDEYLRTKYPNIYACGDLVGPYQHTHAASHQAWYAVVNALFSPFKSYRVDYRVLPRVTFTDPEIAAVGLTESQAREQEIEFELTTYGLDDLDRAIADSEAHGFVKVLTQKGNDRILGVTIVGHQAGNVIGEFVLAMKHGIGLNKILGTVHAYPTMIEANKYAAGVWKRNHAPKKLLDYFEKFHAWRRH